MKWFASLFVVLALTITPLGLAQNKPPGTPFQPLRDPVVDAYNDCMTLTAEQRLFTRYMAIGKAVDPDLAFLTLCSHCNRLSVDPEIILPRLVNPQLMALDLRDYHWSQELWDRLPDPYFLVTVKVNDKKVTINNTSQIEVIGGEGGVSFDGKPFADPKIRKFNVTPPVTYQISVGKETAEVALEKGQGAVVRFGEQGDLRKAFTPFCDVATAAKLIEETQSKIPIVDGRWFYNQTAIQFDRNPGYYDFLGIKKEEDLDRLVGYDQKVLKFFPKEFREAVSVSTVTLQPRRIDRAGTVGGGYWRTSDSRLAVAQHNPLRVLDKGYEYDARESFGHLPNGMIVWGLFNNKGERQDSAPDFIASDSTAPGTDRRVHINLSCIRCHTTGIQDIAGWARSIYAPPNALPAFEKQGDKVIPLPYEEFKRLRRLYLTALEPYITGDRAIYANAVLLATTRPTVVNGKPGVVPGVTVQVDAGNHAKFWLQYEEARVDLKFMARDLNVTEGHLVNALKHQLATVGYLDPLLGNFLGPALPIHIHQWEELYPTAQTIVRGVVPQ